MSARVTGTEAAPDTFGTAKYVTDGQVAGVALDTNRLPTGIYEILAIPSDGDAVTLGFMKVQDDGHGDFSAGRADEVPVLHDGDGLVVATDGIPVAAGVLVGR